MSKSMRRDKKDVPELIPLLDAQTELLADYRRPQTCPRCLQRLSSRFGKDARAQLAARLMCHDFWHACIVNITAPRSDSDITILRQQLRGNMRDCADKDSHPIPLREIGEPLRLFMHALYTFLQHCLSPDGDPDGHAGIFMGKDPKKAFTNRPGMWPVHPSDLVPFGERPSAEVHVRWCCELSSPSAMLSLCCILKGARPILLPSLLEPRLRSCVMWCLVQLLNSDVGQDHFVWDMSVVYALPQPLPSWMCASSSYVSLTLAASFLQTMLWGPDTRPDDAIRLSVGFERALLPALYVALDLVAQFPHFTTTEIHTLARWGCLIHDRMDEPKPALHPECVREWERIDAAFEPGPALYRTYQSTLCNIYLIRTCSASSCGNGIHQTPTGKALPLCAGCKFTQYCSKECQRADWKDEKWPHKDLCPILRRAVPVLQADVKEFMAAVYPPPSDEPGTSNEAIQRFQQWAMELGIISNKVPARAAHRCD